MPRRSVMTPAERAGLLAFPNTASGGNFGRYGHQESLSVRFFPFRELTPARATALPVRCVTRRKSSLLYLPIAAVPTTSAPLPNRELIESIVFINLFRRS